MANKHKKKYSIPFVIRELQIQTMKFHYISIKNDRNPKTDNTKLARIQSKWVSLSLLVDMQNGTTTLEGSLTDSFF